MAKDDYPPDLFKKKTWGAMVEYLAGLEWKAREKGDGYSYSDFALIPVVQEWVKRNGKQAQMLAFEHGVAGSHPPPNVDIAIAAIHAGRLTIDHSTGKEVETPQFAALHGW